MPQKTVHVVSHTHWDREWYLPFELHRRRLVSLLDELLDLLDADPTFAHFHLDGQVIPLLDYLEIRPGQLERIRAAVQTGRLSVGPWFVLQDEFLTSGEANVRNLLYGLREARRFGEPSRVGYLADAFGHFSQMPQLLRGFGIDNAVFGRGVNKLDPNAPPGAPLAQRGYHSEFTWRAPDGSEVLAVYLANWYSNGMQMPTNIEALRPWVEQRLEACARYATTRHLLLMNGCDHTPTQQDLPRALALAREVFPELDFRHTSLEQYVRAVQGEVAELEVATGELRSQYTDGWRTLTNVLSSRIYLKQANTRCQIELERWTEPLSAWRWLLGERYDHDLLDYCWKLLLQNHPHDSICGCSVDDVHREMETRFAKCEALARQVTREGLEVLVSHIDTSACPPGARPVVIYNPLPFARLETCICSVDFPQETAVPDVEVFDGDGAPAEGYLEHDHGVCWDFRLPPDRFRESYTAKRICAAIPALLPPLGYRVYFVRPCQPRPFRLPQGDLLCNDYLEVSLLPDGGLAVFDRTTDTLYEGLNRLQHSRDIGDEYNYRAPVEDMVWNLRLTKREQFSTPLYQTWRLEGEMEANGYVGVTCHVTLGRDARRVDIRTEVENRCKNHRLRVLFPTGIESDVATVDGQFDWVQRPCKPWHGWENPSNCQPQQSFVDVSDETHGLTIANVGLPEYEILQDGRNTIALTLLRAVGELGDWGDFPTPEAQCQSKYAFDYSIIPHDGRLERSIAPQESLAFIVPPDSTPTDVHEGLLPPDNSLLELAPKTIILSALKKCETRNSLLVRVYNPTAQAVEALLVTSSQLTAVYRTNLNEERQSSLPAADGRVAFPVGPKQILTIEPCVKPWK